MSGSAVVIWGPPASGKSTLARIYVEQEGYTEINRDNIRFGEVMPGGDWGSWKWGLEKQVTEIWERKLGNAIIDGLNIVISDTNCTRAKRRKLFETFDDMGYNVSFVGLTSIPLEELIERDAKRGPLAVGAAIVEKFYKEAVNGS